MDEHKDPHPWRDALWVGIGTIAAGMSFSFLHPKIVGSQFWSTPGDLWTTLLAAQYVANGALGYVYEATEGLSTLPLFPVLLSPLAGLGQFFRLTSHPAPHPSMWLLAGPFCFATGILALRAVRSLAHEVAAPGSTLMTQLLMVPLVFAPIMLFGHFEDVLALAFLMFASRLIIRNRSEPSAFQAGLAIAFKLWALMAVPLFVVATRGKRVFYVAVAIALPAMLAAFVLGVDWEHAARALLTSTADPTRGHAALYTLSTGAWENTPPYRAFGLVIAIGVAALLRKDPQPRRMTGAIGVVLLSRLLFDPVVHVYYIGPGLAFLLLHERLAHEGRQSRTLIMGLALILLTLVWYPNPYLWWSIFTAAVLVTAWPALRDLRSAPVGGEGEAVVV